jgi:hypothetical protein
MLYVMEPRSNIRNLVIKISSFALKLMIFLLDDWLGTLWASIGGVPCAIFVEENGATRQKFMCCVFGRDQILLVRNFVYRNTQRREGPMASLLNNTFAWNFHPREKGGVHTPSLPMRVEVPQMYYSATKTTGTLSEFRICVSVARSPVYRTKIR